MEPCSVCGCKIYDDRDGYFYCTSCFTQSQNVIMEVEADGAQRLTKNKVVNDGIKEEILELTSWEEYNYILVGLVDQLIELGAKEEFKLTTLQLWTEYLKRTEVAFFTKTKHDLPRLPYAYKEKDAVIMYDKKRTTRISSKRKASSNATFRRKRQRQVIEAEYKSVISGGTSTNSSVSIQINFSRSARRCLKKIMPKSHIAVHAKADSRLNCHKQLARKITYKAKLEKIGPRFLGSLLYIALNKVNEKIQLGDLMRWFREGHLSVMHIERFFPEKYKLSRRMIDLMGQLALMSHDRFRLTTASLLRFMNIEWLNRPDFTQLCRRYVTELSLPDDVFKYAERLIRLYPPIMKTQSHKSESVPNYEGRAMAYIIFILKVIFGLNGTTEELLSDSADEVNSKIGKPKLFCFRKWMNFLELRKIILSQYHFPTKLSTGISSDSDASLYMHYLNSIQTCTSLDEIDVKNRNKFLQPLFEAMLKIADIHQVNEDVKIADKIIKFQPSLTPNSDYLIYLLKMGKTDGSKLSSEVFQQSEIDCYLKKNSLRRDFRENYNISLKFCKIRRKIINLNKNVVDNIFSRERSDILQKLNMGLTSSVEIIDKRKKKGNLNRSIEKVLQEALYGLTNQSDKKQKVKLIAENAKYLVNEHNYGFHYVPVQRNLSDSESEVEETFDTESEFVFEENPKKIDQTTPNRDLESNLLLFDNQSEDGLSLSDDDNWSDMNEEIKFYIPNFYYWRRIGHTGHELNEIYERVERELPNSFNWLLHECARIVENKPHELYLELLTIETGFACLMKPLNLKTKRVKFRKLIESKNSLNKLPKDWIYARHLKNNW